MNAENNRIVVVDVKMPFMSMVVFMVKWSIASIPAFLILLFLAAVILAMFGGVAGLPV